MDSLIQDLRYAIRTLLRSPGFTLVAVITLALGIGANTAIFSALYGVLLRPLPYPEPGQLVGLGDSYRGDRGVRAVTYREFRFIQSDTSIVERWATSTRVGWNLFAGSLAERINGLRVSSDYFRLLGAHMELGRGFLSEEDVPGGPNVVVLGYPLWRRRFAGDPAIVGRSITLDGAPFTVVGVLPASFRPMDDVDAYSTMGQVANTIGGGENLRLLGRVRAGASPAQAQARSRPLLAAFMRQFTPDAPSGFAVELFPLRELLAGTVRMPLMLLFAAVGLVLLIACANVASLVLGRTATRGHELAVRAALGAGRGRLVRQLLTESLALALLGGAAGVVAAGWSLNVLVAAVPSELAAVTVIRLDGWALVFAAGAVVASGVAFGLVASWRPAGADLYGPLKEGTGRSTASAGVGRFRNALVVGEIALSLILLVGAGLLIQSMRKLVATDPGFDRTHVLAAELWLTGSGHDSTADISAFYERLIGRLDAQPGVRSAAVIEAGIPFLQGGNLAVAVDGVYPPETINYRTVTPEYFGTMGIPLEQGRVFAASDGSSAEPVAVVSESFARRFLGSRPLDRMVTVGGRTQLQRRVIGVVGDVRQFIGAPPLPTAYLASAQTPAGLTRLFSGWFPIHVVVRAAGDPGALAGTVERTIHAADARVPVGRVRTMDEILSGSVSLERLVMLLLAVFAALALVLAAVGVYGVMSYLVTQRAHEIGVRVALGAVRGDVLALVLRRGLALTGAGVGLGLAGAAALSRLLGSQLYGVRPFDPATFVAVGGLLVVVALVACVVPARRAARVDPVAALRSE